MGATRVRALWLSARRGLWILGVLVRSGMIAPMRPDKYVRQGLVMRRHGVNPLSGLGLSAVRSPHGLALVDELGQLTWRELDARVDALAVGLAAEGAGPEVAVAIMCRNHRGLVETLAACSRVGADALLLNTGFSAVQLADVMAREGAGVIVYDEEFAALVGPTRDRLPDLKEFLGWQDLLGSPSQSQGPIGIATLIDSRRGQRPPAPGRAGRVVLLTSGTTGTPKGARRSADGGAGALAAMFDRIPWRAGEPVVVAAPAFHAFGFGQVAIAFTLACPVILRRKFDPAATMRLVDEHRATGLAVVPVMIERIVDLAAADRVDLGGRSLRFVTASGSRMRSDAVLTFMDRYGEVIYNSYNATEAGLITTAVPADLRAAPTTAGRPVVGTEIRILDDEGGNVAPGDIGRIAVTSGVLFEGYTSGDTKQFLDDYMMTGDLGRLDGLGRLYVVGRDDDMIVSGGENVYPSEVERTLLGHPDVRDCAVIGVDDVQFGQRLAAFVVPVDGVEPDGDVLRDFVRSQLASFKVPRELVLLAELPRNASGKIVVGELQASRSAVAS